MKTTMNLEEHNSMKEKREKKIKSKDKDKNIEKDLLGNKKNKKSFNKSHNNGVFRINYKNYQYDYEEDFYEPY